MKKAKLLSLFLAGVLVFQTAGMDTLATETENPVVITEGALDESGSGNSDSLTQENSSEDESESEKSTENDSSTGESKSEESTENDSSKDESKPEESTENDSSKDEENMDSSSAEEGDKNDSAEGEENLDQPSVGDEDMNDPSEGEENPDQSSAGNEEIELPSEDEENLGAPTTGEEEGDVTDEDTTEESIQEDSVSENTVSENTVSENTVSEEKEDIFDIFPGLGDNYIMSSQQLADKNTLALHMDDVVKTNARTADDYVDKEGIYELGEVIYLADDKSEAERIAAAFGGTLDSYAYEVAIISLPEDATVAMAVAAAANPEIKLPAVWPNYYNYLDSDMPELNAVYEPTDPDFNKQWHHDYIGTRYAWAAGYKGEGIRVAVIDTGLKKDHEDFGANVNDGYSFVNLSGSSAPVYNSDNATHGTHVAGIIGAANNNKGVVGIAPEATVSGFCVADTSGALTGDILAAIQKAIEDKYDIINMSLGGPYYNDLFAKQVKKAYDAGVAVFASSGNDDSDGNNFPAAYPGAISVGAVDQNGSRASFSNYGSAVKLSFPGVGIYSTTVSGYPDAGSGGTYGDYGYMSGTSQASPAAAGTAAVILSANENIRKKTGKARVDALLSAMKSSTTKCSSSGMGAGTTWLPGVLKIASDMTAPDAPVIEFDESQYQKSGNNYIAESVNVTLSTKTAVDVEIYYSTNGKNPTYKNGQLTNVAEEKPYTIGAAISLGGAKKVTIKAVAINPITGKMSKVASKSFTLTPLPAGVKLTSAGNVKRIAAGKSLKLTAAVTPAYVTSKKVSWSVDDTAKANGITVSNGTVRTKNTTQAGTYIVTATALGNDGKPISTVKDDFTLTVIAKAEIQKVAFQKEGNTYKTVVLDLPGTLDLKDYLKVTKVGNTEGNSADVVWSSSNQKAVTVEEGLITAVAPGKATIKATANDGSGKSASCNVTVNQPITKITISGPAKVAVGKSINLSAKVEPTNATNKKLTWKAEGNNLVTVAGNGKVTAKKGATGTCKITATAKDSQGVSSDAYTITVISGEITKITLSESTLTLFSPKAAIKDAKDAPTEGVLASTVEGKAGYDQTMTIWTSSAPGVASVDQNGKVKAKTAGKTTITCTATDGSKKKASCTVTVAVPMSKLVIGTKDSYGAWDSEGYYGYIAAGKNIKMSAKYSSNYGTPTNKQVTWSSSNESVLTVDKNGKVSAKGDAPVGSSAKITAIAKDGSKVTSNSYEFIVTPLYKRIDIEPFLIDTPDGNLEGGYVVVATDKAGNKGIPYGLNYFTVNVAGGKNAGCYKGIQKERPGVNPACYYLQPIPGKVTTTKQPSYTGDFYTSDAQKMTLTVKLRDGSGLSAKKSLYAVRFSNNAISYFK